MTNIYKKQSNYFILILLLGYIFFVCSCTGSKSITSTEEPFWKKDVPLTKSFEKIILQKFEVDQDLEKNYPGVTMICESTTMNELLKVSSISKIEKARASSIRQTGALVVRTRVTTLRLTSGISNNQNINSEIAVNVRLIDSSTGRIIREKDLSTLANPSNSSSSGGNSDQMLPYDLGKIIARYVASALGEN
jgi:hypothetical protein